MLRGRAAGSPGPERPGPLPGTRARGRGARNLGLAYQHSGDFSRAEQEFTRALAENPTFPDLRYQRARIYERSGRTDEAIADLQRALAEHPHYMEAHLLLAVCLGARSDREGSASALAQALALGLEAPEWVTPEIAKNWSGEEWRRLLPGGTDARSARGPLDEALARQQAGDLSGAIAALTQAVSDQPGYADLRCRLAGLLLEARQVELRHSTTCASHSSSTRAISRRDCWRRARSSSAAMRARRKRRSRWRSKRTRNTPTCGSGSGWRASVAATSRARSSRSKRRST